MVQIYSLVSMMGWREEVECVIEFYARSMSNLFASSEARHRSKQATSTWRLITNFHVYCVLTPYRNAMLLPYREQPSTRGRLTTIAGIGTS